jgi:hypothetical protein
MLDINVNDSRDLNFKIELSGIASSQLEGRLRLVIDNIEYGIPAKIKEGSIDIVIPPLRNLIQRELKEGEIFTAKLDVHGDGNYLNPWSGEFQIRNPVALEAKIVELEDDNKPVISVSINESGTKKEVPSITEEEMTKKIFNKIATKLRSKMVKEEKVIEPIKEVKKIDIKNITEDDVYNYMTRAGTSKKEVQKLIYEQAEVEAGSSIPVQVLKQVVKVLKK